MPITVSLGTNNVYTVHVNGRFRTQATAASLDPTDALGLRCKNWGNGDANMERLHLPCDGAYSKSAHQHGQQVYAGGIDVNLLSTCNGKPHDWHSSHIRLENAPLQFLTADAINASTTIVAASDEATLIPIPWIGKGSGSGCASLAAIRGATSLIRLTRGGSPHCVECAVCAQRVCADDPRLGPRAQRLVWMHDPRLPV